MKESKKNPHSHSSFKPNKGLGRGVDALFFNTDGPTNTEKYTELSISSIITSKFQARKVFDQQTLNELAQSIKKNGILQPIIVRRNPRHNNYEIVAGERRLRAAKIAGLRFIPSIIKNLSEQDASLIGLVENLQREDLNCIDEAKGIKQLIESFNLTHEKCSQIINKSRSVVTNSLRLLELNQDVQNLLKEGLLDMSHARTLLSIDKNQQILVANNLIKNKISVRKLEQLTKNTKKHSQTPISKDNADLEITKNIEQLEEKFGLEIDLHIQPNRKLDNYVKKGYIKFNFSRIDQLNHLLKQLKG